MKALRESAAANIENELEGLKAIRSDALAKLAALEALEQQHREQQVRTQTPHDQSGVRSSYTAQSIALAAMTSSSTSMSSPSQSTSRSLKRKRSIEDDDDGEEVECDDGSGDMSLESTDRRVVKRMRTGRGAARRIVSTAAYTAGVMTVGAIATWTALAFAPETF